jgi:hypothetical protein
LIKIPSSKRGWVAGFPPEGDGRISPPQMTREWYIPLNLSFSDFENLIFKCLFKAFGRRGKQTSSKDIWRVGFPLLSSTFTHLHRGHFRYACT